MAGYNSDTAWQRILKPWWAKLIFGVLMLIFTRMEYHDFVRLETGETKSLFLATSTKFLYDIGGKTLAVGLVVVVGLGSIGVGAYQFAQENK